MATRPSRPRPAQPGPAQPRAARAQSAKAQAVKARSATAQAPKAQSSQPQPGKPQPGKPQPGKPQAAEPSQPVAPPRELRLAAVIQAAEAVGMLVAAGFAGVATADGKSYEKSSGIALTLIAVATAALFAAFAVGLARARPWTRTPVVMFQLAIGIWGVFLLTGHRYEWGVPMLVVAAATLACLFTPASLRALNRPSPPRP
jgi:hypothetical protein